MIGQILDAVMGAGQQATQSQRFISECCVKCGIQFFVPEHYDKRRRDDGQAFYCPNGHGQSYKETEADRLRREIARQKQIREHTEADCNYYREQRDIQKRKASAARGQVTKLKNRVKNGVCPCCNRTFADLQRHMASQHPDFAHKDE